MKNYEEIFKLSQFAFQYSLTEKQLKEKAEEAKRHKIWGYIVEGELAGKIHIIPLQIYLNGKTFDMGGISSVATWPEYRRQGIAKKLMIHALKEMKRAGQVISLLHPFHVGFYRKYGWELTYMKKNYILPFDKIKRIWNGEGYIRRTENISLLDSIYHKFAKQYNGMIVRDEKWWKQRVLTDDEVQIAVAYDKKGETEGYLIYKVRNNVFIVQEMAFSSLNGQHIIYEFIGNHDSMANEVRMTVPENDQLPLKIADPFFKQELEPYFMTRIVDVMTFLKYYTYSEVDGIVWLTVKDEILTENSGYYCIQTESVKTSVSKVTSIKGPEIRCNVQQLAQMFLGFKRPNELYKEKMITGEAEAINRLDKMIPNRQTFLTDFY